MPAQTMATADALLKDTYPRLIVEQVNYMSWLLDKIERTEEHVNATGRRAVVPLDTQGNPSRGSMSDGGTLVTPSGPSQQDAIVNIRDHNAGFEITEKTLRLGKGDGAIVDVLDRGTKNIGKTTRKNVNRQLYGDGTGLLASVASGSGPATTVTVDATQYLNINDPVDVLTRSNGAAVSAGRTITAINRTTKVVTLDASVTVTTNEGLYLAGSYGNEIDAGLRAATATGRTLHGINSSTAGNEFWNGNEVPAATPGNTATATESLFEQLADAVGPNQQNPNSEADGIFLTTRGIRRRLADTYTSNKRFNDANAVKVHGGYTAIFVNEIAVLRDDDAPKGFAFYIPGESDDDWAFLYQAGEPDWLKSGDGTVWHLASGSVAGTKRSAWWAWWVWFVSLGVLAPNRTGRIIRCADDYV